MVGQYFKEKREVAEMVVLCGPGFGLLVFSLLYKHAVGSAIFLSIANASQCTVGKHVVLGIFRNFCRQFFESV